MRLLVVRDLTRIGTDEGRVEGDLTAAGDTTEIAQAADIGIRKAASEGSAKVEFGLEIFEIQREIEHVCRADALCLRLATTQRAENCCAGSAEACRLDERAPPRLEVQLTSANDALEPGALGVRRNAIRIHCHVRFPLSLN